MKRRFKALKSVISAALACTMLLCFLPTVGAANGVGEHLLGDVNLSGNVDIADVTAIQKDLVGLVELSKQSRELADVNADGEISITDATYIQKYCAGSITTFPGSEIEGIELIEGLNDITVKIEGEIPQGARLALSPVEKSSVDKLIEKMGADRAVFACDIKIYDKDNAVWQPSEPVKITISGVTDIGEYAQAGVYHVSGDFEQAVENADEAVQSIEDVTMNAEQGEAVFETSGFSTFVGYTVDFHNGDKVFSIAGESSVLLSEVLDKIGITDYTAADVAAMTFSNPNYIAIEQKDGDWLLNSLAPFSTEESLNITLNNGEKVSIKVTDADDANQTTLNLSSGGETAVKELGRYFSEVTNDTTKKVLTLKVKNKTGFNYAEIPGFSVSATNSPGRDSSKDMTLSAPAKVILVIDSGVTEIRLLGKILIRNGFKLEINIGELKKPCTIYRYGRSGNGFNDHMIELGAGASIEVLDRGLSAANETLTFSGKTSPNGTIPVTSEEMIYTQAVETDKDGNVISYTPTPHWGSGYNDNGFLEFHNTNFADLRVDANKAFQDAYRGGAVRVSGPAKRSQLIFDNCDFTNMTTEGTSGTIEIGKNTVNYTIPGSNTHGMALRVDDRVIIGEAYTKDTTANANYNMSTRCINFNYCDFTNLQAHIGGAISLFGVRLNQKLRVVGCNFNGCTAIPKEYNGGQGGAISISGCKGWEDNFKKENDDHVAVANTDENSSNVYMENTTFDKCMAGNTAAVYFHGYSNIYKAVMKDCTVINCKSFNPTGTSYGEIDGSVVRSTGNSAVNLKIDGGCYGVTKDGGSAGNYSLCGNGGAICFNSAERFFEYAETDKYRADNPTPTIEITGGCQIKNNYSGWNGGGVMVGSKAVFNKCTISDNTAEKNGGGVYQTIYSHDTIPSSDKGTDITVNDTAVIHDNIAYGSGGGVAIDIVPSISVLRKAVEVKKATIAEEKITSEDILDFIDNSYPVKFNLNGAEIYKNHAYQNGGGVAYISAEGLENKTVTAKDITQTVNAQKMVDAFKKSINLGDGTEYYTHKTAIYENIADGNGAGIYASGKNSKVTVNKAYIYSNTATGNGGGLYVTGENSEIKVISESQIGGDRTPNKAANGGGAYANNGTVNITDGNVYYNKATSDGGGVYANGGTVTVSGGNVNDNTATNGDGGGVYAYGGTVTVSGGNVNDNTANDSGGGVYANGGTVTVSGGNVNGNTATTNDGGGIDAENGTVNINNGNVNGNTAGRNGGGVFADNGSVNITKTGTEYPHVEGNTADNGGGVYAVNGGNITLENGFVVGNTAISSDTPAVKTSKTEASNLHGVGGGIFVADGEDNNPSSFKLTGVSGIYNNTATFAADDVFANGNKTKLDVPAFKNMNLTADLKAKLDGWYEDYCDEDTSYEEGLKRNNAGRRYKPIPIANSNLKGKIENVDDVNTANAYVCMTLGVKTNGTASFTKNLVDSNGNDINEHYKDLEFTFTIKDANGKIPSGVSYKIYNPIEGSVSTGTLSDEGTFKLRPGETITFTDVTTGEYVITETKVENFEKYVTNTTSTYKTLNGQVVDDTKTITQVFKNQTVDNAYEQSFNISTETNADVEFTSVVKSIELTYKYYGAEVVTGKPMDISNTPTEVKKTLIGAEYDAFMQGKATLAEALKSYGESLNIGNALEEYFCWGSQQDAETAFKDGKNDWDKRKYTGETVTYHTDRSGNVMENGEQWVTLVDNENGTVGATVWFFNKPKQYTIKVGSETNAEEIKAYYNQRLGIKVKGTEMVNPHVNDTTPHLARYGIDGYVEQLVGAADYVTNVGTKKFKYWTVDGENASNDYYYHYRVLKNATITAVYGEDAASQLTPGVTVERNKSEFFFKDSQAMIRLNTGMNFYGLDKKADGTYEQPQMVGALYVVTKEDKVTTANAKELLQAYFDMNPTPDTGTLTKINSARTNAYFYTVKNNTGDDSVELGQGEVLLTNKNRAVFALDFSKSFLENQRILVFGVMKYKDTWILSENYVDYNKDFTEEVAQ